MNFNENPKPIFLIGIPVLSEMSEKEFNDINISISEKKKELHEKMPDYHIVVYTCDKIEQITFTILTADGKQSNV